MMKPDKIPSRMVPGARVAVVAISALALAGCAETMPWVKTAKPKTIEQVVVPQPEPTAPARSAAKKAVSTSTRKAGPVVTKTAPPIPAPRDLALSVTYLVRILVPVGSELTVRAEAASGAPSIKTIATAGGPPYALQIPVSGEKSAYPMTVNATLQSSIGHTLKGAVTLDQPPGEKPVEIVLAPISE